MTGFESQRAVTTSGPIQSCALTGAQERLDSHFKPDETSQPIKKRKFLRSFEKLTLEERSTSTSTARSREVDFNIFRRFSQGRSRDGKRKSIDLGAESGNGNWLATKSSTRNGKGSVTNTTSVKPTIINQDHEKPIPGWNEDVRSAPSRKSLVWAVDQTMIIPVLAAQICVFPELSSLEVNTEASIRVAVSVTVDLEAAQTVHRPSYMEMSLDVVIYIGWS